MDLYELSELMSEMKQNIEGIILLGYLILGLIAVVQCFFGYKLIRIWIALIGGVIGGIVGIFIATISMNSNEAIVAIVAFICMILGGFLAYKIYMLGIFCVGLMGGALVGFGLGILLGMGSDSIAMAFIVAILGGIGSVTLAKPMIILLTAIPAAIQLTGIMGVLFGNIGIGIGLGFVFAIGGIWFQFKDNKKVNESQSVETEADTNGSGDSKVEADRNESGYSQISATLEEPSSQATQQQSTDFILDTTGKTKEEWLEILKQQRIMLSKKAIHYIEIGKEKGKEGYKQFIIWSKALKAELILKGKKAVEIVKRPKVRKKILIGTGIVAGLLILIIGGKWMYNDSLQYRIPEEARLQELANEYFQPGIDYRSPMEIKAIRKQNRKSYEITLEGYHQEGDILMLGTFKAYYTYDGNEWSMSIPELKESEESRVTSFVSIDQVYDYLVNQMDFDEDHNAATPMVVKSNNIEVKHGDTEHERIYTYIFEVVEGILGYEVTGDIKYKIGEENVWEVDPATFTYEIKENGVVTKPNETEVLQLLSEQGLELEGYGKVYYTEDMLKVVLKTFEEKQTNWLATFEVSVKAPYLSGDFEISVPYTVQDEGLYIQDAEAIKVKQMKLDEMGSKLPSLDQETLQTMWKENNRIYIYNEESQESVDYTLDENAQVTIGAKCKVDMRNQDEKLVIGYNLQVVTNQHELTCQINVPYKEVLGEMLEQLRLVTYTNQTVTIYPITQQRIQDDLKNIYLDMESSTQIVHRNTGEDIEKLEIMDKKVEEDVEIYKVMVKFNIEENEQKVTYVGEYDMTYKVNSFEYTLYNIQFVGY